MATIRVRDWTKERITEIRENESHSSHDSVIKSLLKDHELARFAGSAAQQRTVDPETAAENTVEKEFDDLTVFDELTHVENGVMFLWCPSCGNEIAHLDIENPIQIPVLEMECQRCLTLLDQYALVCIEIGYPIERRIADEKLQADLKACVIDYWDRKLKRLTDDGETDIEQYVWQFNQYAQQFNWDWPSDVPAVAFESGSTYRNTATGEYIEVLEIASENRNALNSYRIRRYHPDADHPEESDPEIIESSAVINLIASRNLIHESDSQSVRKLH